MAVPKHRKSKSRSRMRRSYNMARKPPQVQYCARCGSAGPSHTVCENCGFYMGRTLVETEE